MSEVEHRPTDGVTTAGPDEPYVNCTSTVLWEAPPGNGGAYPIGESEGRGETAPRPEPSPRPLPTADARRSNTATRTRHTPSVESAPPAPSARRPA